VKILTEQEVRKLTLDDEVIVKYTEKQKDAIISVYGSFENMIKDYQNVCGTLMTKLWDGIGPVYVSGILTAEMHTNTINAANGYPADPVRVEDTGVCLFIREFKDEAWPCLSLDIRSITVARLTDEDLVGKSNQGRTSCIKCNGPLTRADTGMSFYDICPKCKV
jgi:hypothetical protein